MRGGGKEKREEKRELGGRVREEGIERKGVRKSFKENERMRWRREGYYFYILRVSSIFER